MTTEYTIPLAIRAALSIVLEPDQALTRELIDAAIDGFNTEWENHALNTQGPGTIYADCIGPLNNDWRGETHDKITGETGRFDLRTDNEKVEHFEAIEDLMRELLEFNSADPTAQLTFLAEWRQRAARALEARR